MQAQLEGLPRFVTVPDLGEKQVCTYIYIYTYEYLIQSERAAVYIVYTVFMVYRVYTLHHQIE